ncbi:hypothetical protein RGUI_3382 [Rhodovulum sp. P5]|uniref:hypothetical protein n=1 Tax=Rhodovulum sp. P5 TaxID=1564506 RepID=UPI0009C28AF4|nr:hypothetical protein [Rhodovulum sp. P5]ARE41523.1 hypothetical protein RGUI_3382 [Rhodovulum sp. P5]
MRYMTTGFWALSLAALSPGCTPFPDIDTTEPAREVPAIYPRLIPIDPLLVPEQDPRVTPQLAGAIDASGATLRARAVSPVPAGDETSGFEARAAILRQKAAALKARSE